MITNYTNCYLYPSGMALAAAKEVENSKCFGLNKNELMLPMSNCSAINSIRTLPYIST